MDPILESFYEPLKKLLSRPNLVELSVVGDGRIAFETADKGYICENFPSFNISYWRLFCSALANYGGLKFNPPQDCFLSTVLPEGHRFQAKMGFGVDSGVDISIRLFRDISFPLEKFGLNGSLKKEVVSRIKRGSNCIISGGTSSGKTTLLRSLLKYVDETKRIITVEDTREIFMPDHFNKSHHIVSRNGTAAQSTKAYADEIDHMVRSRPDIIILGEISTSNSLPILRFLNSGHAGFFTTIHANTPKIKDLRQSRRFEI